MTIADLLFQFGALYLFTAAYVCIWANLHLSCPRLVPFFFLSISPLPHCFSLYECFPMDDLHSGFHCSNKQRWSFSALKSNLCPPTHPLFSLVDTPLPLLVIFIYAWLPSVSHLCLLNFVDFIFTMYLSWLPHPILSLT